MKSWEVDSGFAVVTYKDPGSGALKGIGKEMEIRK